MHVKGDSEYYYLVMDGDEAIAICATEEEARTFIGSSNFTIKPTQKVGEEVVKDER